ncbi:MAG: hypothetical protein RMK89_11705 [Armatimonadota bacterium]|nr:hypothetical protein [Armatimonadota bacterium]MDW8144113.1 hypothetical protein [Armatimonadota bacterium]
MMNKGKLKAFWSLAKKVIGKDEAKIRKWLHDHYKVWSPHDLKPDQQDAVLARLEMMQSKDGLIAVDVWNEGKVFYCPQLHELLEDFCKRRNWQWHSKGGIVKRITENDFQLLYKLLAYFTPCHLADSADLLARINASIRRNGYSETMAAILTFFDYHEKFNKRKHTIPGEKKLGKEFLLRLIRRIYAARRRFYERILRERLADNIAKAAMSEFARATKEAAKEAIERRRKIVSGN